MTRNSSTSYSSRIRKQIQQQQRARSARERWSCSETSRGVRKGSGTLSRSSCADRTRFALPVEGVRQGDGRKEGSELPDQYHVPKHVSHSTARPRRADGPRAAREGNVRLPCAWGTEPIRMGGGAVPLGNCCGTRPFRMIPAAERRRSADNLLWGRGVAHAHWKRCGTDPFR